MGAYATAENALRSGTARKTPGKIYGYLEPFAAVFARKDARVSDGIRALYELLTQLDTQHQLWNREQQLLAQGEETRSRNMHRFIQS